LWHGYYAADLTEDLDLLVIAGIDKLIHASAV
jgi:hypothetical protein